MNFALMNPRISPAPEEVRQRHVTFMNILISLVLIHDSPYKIVHSVFLIDGLFRCKLPAFPESTTCENPV